MDFESNERTEEWLLIIGDRFRTTNPRWFMALGLVLLLAVPGYFASAFIFTNILSATVKPITVNYTEVAKQPLEISEKKIFSFGDGTYSGFARIKNSNFDWGVPDLKYQAIFKGSGEATAMSLNGTTFILPSSEKIIVFPRFSASIAPVDVDIQLSDQTFIRPPNFSALTMEIQRRNIEVQDKQTLVSAVIVNKTPFKVRKVDLPVLLFDSNNQIVGANYTNINDLASAESRSFQYTWFSRIDNVARIEILPELNIFDRTVFQIGSGQNPFDNRDKQDE